MESMDRVTRCMMPTGWPGFSSTEHSAGDSVRALMAEMTMAAEMVTANCAEQHAGRAGQEGHRHEHRQQHERDGDDRTGDLRHGLARRLGRRQMRLRVHDALDVLDDDDGVIDDDADGKHEGEQEMVLAE